jgi:hypothetical protein
VDKWSKSCLSHLDIAWNDIRSDRKGKFAGLLPQFLSLSHLNIRCNRLRADGVGSLLECFRSAERSLISILEVMTSQQTGQRVLQEFCRSAERWLASSSASLRMKSAMPGRVFVLLAR